MGDKVIFKSYNIVDNKPEKLLVQLSKTTYFIYLLLAALIYIVFIIAVFYSPNYLLKTVASNNIKIILTLLTVVLTIVFVIILIYSVKGLIKGKVFNFNISFQTIYLNESKLCLFSEVDHLLLKSVNDREWDTFSLILVLKCNIMKEIVTSLNYKEVEILAQEIKTLLNINLILNIKNLEYI